MTIQSKLVTFIAAGMLLSSVAAHAQTAPETDPNIAPSTAEEELTLPETPRNSPQLARDPDPDEGPTIGGVEAQLPATSPDSPQLAQDPELDIAPSGDMSGK